jgi:hypothetical protein
MRPYPRTRKTAKWLLTTMTILLAGAAIGSLWYGLTIDYLDPGDRVSGSVKIDHGILRWSRYWGGRPRAARLDWELTRIQAAGPRPQWTWRFYDPGPAGKHLFLPLWIPAALTMLPAALAWRHDLRMRRRARAGECPSCGYPRAGLAPDAKCPECGAAPTKQG